MPSSITLRNFVSSRAMSSLNDDTFRFFVLLLQVVDPFGRTEACPDLLRAKCYPLRMDRVKRADISRFIAECKDAELICLYKSDTKQVLAVKKYGQRIYHNSFSEFCDPPSDVIDVLRYTDRPVTAAKGKRQPGDDPGLRGDDPANSALCSMPNASRTPQRGGGREFERAEKAKTAAENAKRELERKAAKA